MERISQFHPVRKQQLARECYVMRIEEALSYLHVTHPVLRFGAQALVEVARFPIF